MFVQLRPPLAPATVLPVLRGVSPTLCAPYLEAALAAHVASRETYETELAVMYLQALLEGGSWSDGEVVYLCQSIGQGETKLRKCMSALTGMRTTLKALLIIKSGFVAGHNGDAKPAQRSPFAAPEKFPAKLDKGEAFKKLKYLVGALTSPSDCLQQPHHHCRIVEYYMRVMLKK